jgi:VWFA-related protein
VVSRTHDGKQVFDITLSFTITRADGSMATDVTKDEIVVYEDGLRVAGLEIYQPRTRDAVTVLLALDTSGSMAEPADDSSPTPKIDALRRAASRFADTLHGVARVSLLPFSTRVGTPRPFLTNPAILKSDVGGLKADGETSLFDAVFAAVSTLEADQAPGRRAVIALTDGIDNQSRRRVEEVIERAKDAGVPLYLLGFGREGELDEKVMTRMAAETGGQYYHARNEDKLIEIFDRLSTQLQSTYTVTFRSRRPTFDGTLRDIDIRVERQGAKVSDVANFQYNVRGVVVPQVNPGVYLLLLLLLGLLLAAPAGLRRRGRRSDGD